MSAPHTLPESRESLSDVPEFDLAYAVDDRDDPSTVTVFPADGKDPTTTWISIDVDSAVGLEDVR